MSSSPIIVALDFPNEKEALTLVDQLEPGRCRLKVGKELFTRSGPEFVKKLVKQNFDVFLDLKFHDIPNTVARACQAGADLGVWMINVHAMGGRKMLEAAREALPANDGNPKLIAVTVLTSIGADDLKEIGLTSSPAEQVKLLATLTNDCGLDGVVCSPQEIALLREDLDTSFELVTPGIRPEWSVTGDQKRIMTPAQAVKAGSNYLVIGRPITQAEQPMQALEKIEKELDL
ncbi:MAG: orotidine-5'-phosphate decarboxylase [Gammaproteobacteria bacterium]|nr:orotidine-5'-phosphate decarboxylase [Gammaproteobacteria bacterium]